jgi:hypothetical protein
MLKAKPFSTKSVLYRCILKLWGYLIQLVHNLHCDLKWRSTPSRNPWRPILPGHIVPPVAVAVPISQHNGPGIEASVPTILNQFTNIVPTVVYCPEIDVPSRTGLSFMSLSQRWGIQFITNKQSQVIKPVLGCMGCTLTYELVRYIRTPIKGVKLAEAERTVCGLCIDLHLFSCHWRDGTLNPNITGYQKVTASSSSCIRRHITI